MRIALLSFLLICLVPLAHAQDIPLAVTITAYPTMMETPTAGQIELAETYLKTGLKFLERKNFARAIAEFQDSIKQVPGAKNYLGLGTAYFDAGDKARAAWAYRQSLAFEPNPKVQALVDSFEGKEDLDATFADSYAEQRFYKLMGQGAKARKAGKQDTAFAAYRDAYEIKKDSEAREPMAAIGVALAEKHLDSGNLKKAGKVIHSLKDAFEDAKDLNDRETALYKRLDKVSDRLIQATGDKIRKTEKALETEKDKKNQKFKMHIETESR